MTVIVYKATSCTGESAHFGVESAARAWARSSGKVERIELRDPPEISLVKSGSDEPIDIDDRYAGRLALLLECMLIDPNGYWNEAANLLDEYKAEWDKVNPRPPTFMGEPMPPERKARLMAMKAQRAAMSTQSEKP